MDIIEAYKYYYCINCKNRKHDKCKIRINIQNKIIIAKCDEYKR